MIRLFAASPKGGIRRKESGRGALSLTAWTARLASTIIVASGQGASMDVGDWLKSLGLERHEPAFRDNSIDADVLPDLTDGDLEKLGVNLGDRKRLVRAIAALAAPGSPANTTSRAPAAG